MRTINNKALTKKKNNVDLAFYWRGQLVTDLEAFCSEHNTRMVKYRATRKVPNIFGRRMETEIEFGEMPEIFFDTLLMVNGWFYEKYN